MRYLLLPSFWYEILVSVTWTENLDRVPWALDKCGVCLLKFLPTPFAWYFHQLPEWLQRLADVTVITAQIAGSLLMLSPIKGQRLVAFYSQVRPEK